MDPIQPQAPETMHRKSLGPIIAIVVVLILLVIAALYFWGEKITNRNGAEATVTTETMLANDEVMPPSNNSDEVSDLETELQTSGSTDVDLTGLESI